MPRGSRKKSIEDQIAEVDSKINELQEQKKQLLAEKDRKNRQLLDAAKEAGISPAELVQQLKSQKVESPSNTI